MGGCGGKTLTGSALYPNIDVSDQTWLRSALLYWDNIYTIVPAISETLRDPGYANLCH